MSDIKTLTKEGTLRELFMGVVRELPDIVAAHVMYARFNLRRPTTENDLRYALRAAVLSNALYNPPQPVPGGGAQLTMKQPMVEAEQFLYFQQLNPNA